jgi:hypothetical protein
VICIVLASAAILLTSRCNVPAPTTGYEELGRVKSVVVCSRTLRQADFTRAHFYRSSRCESVMSSTFGTHL